MPKHILLTGAGFSRNWGGWLAKELEGDLLARLGGSPALRKLVQDSENFELALETARTRFRDESPGPSGAVGILERAIGNSFEAINRAFAQRRMFEFSVDRAKSVTAFLGRFDAIFTLNQDLLLELHYDPSLELTRRWAGACYPGILPMGQRPATVEEKLSAKYLVGEIPPILGSCQPIFKLHGSVNWSDEKGQLFIVGGGKAEHVQRIPLLRRYLEEFEQLLRERDCHLMIIGYGFGDEHINEVIVDASNNNVSLGIFHVHPEGRDAVHRNRRQKAYVYGPPPIAAVPCIGESRRPLSTTFNSDDLEQGKLMRFFGA